MDRAHRAVANTGLLVAAIRARETDRDDRLFADPYAARLAGDAGRAQLAAAVAESGDESTAEIVVRTRFLDEALLSAGIGQVVILAAGMDARAYRLPWVDGTAVYELDQPEVMDTKAQLLAGEAPRCRRVPVGVDLADDWPAALSTVGFDPAQPTAWLIEGLLQYLDEAAVGQLFARIDALSAAGSRACFDVVGKSLLDAPFLAPLLETMAAQGSPWLFGTDQPGELLGRHGWSAVVTDVAEPGYAWGRWPTPPVPPEVPDVPRGYFVVAAK